MVKTISIGAIFVLLVIVALSIVGVVSTPFTQGARLVSKTLDADNVVSNYEWFKRQVQDVSAIDLQIRNAQASYDAFSQSAGPRSDWGFEDKQEANRLSSVLLGLKNNREAMVAEYNSRSQMANRTLFKTNDLPVVLR